MWWAGQDSNICYKYLKYLSAMKLDFDLYQQKDQHGMFLSCPAAPKLQTMSRLANFRRKGQMNLKLRIALFALTVAAMAAFRLFYQARAQNFMCDTSTCNYCVDVGNGILKCVVHAENKTLTCDVHNETPLTLPSAACEPRHEAPKIGFRKRTRSKRAGVSDSTIWRFTY
jgi:hypothetical protein